MSHLIPKGHKNLLEREIAFYERNRAEFLDKHPGRFLLIFGENLEGVFNEVDDAITEGIHKFGMDPFLVRKSGEDTPVFHVPFEFWEHGLAPIPLKHRVILAPNITVPELQGQIPTAETFYQVAPFFALQIHGPVCVATIQPSPDRQAVLSEYDIPIKTRSGLVVFDTGAGMSCIDESAATEMLLPIVGTGRVRGVNSERKNVPVCSAQLVLTTQDEKEVILPMSQAFALPLENQELLAIIGRDIMKFGDLIYEGFFGRAFFDFATHTFPENE